MNENIPELSIEPMTDESGSLIILEQDSGGNLDRVAIHPLHLRHMAERFGLIPAGDPQAQRTIASLTRRLHVLHARIEHLAEWLAIHSDHKHADLTYEQTYARATADIADEFCAELSAQVADESQSEPSNATQRHATPPERTDQEESITELAHSYFAAP